jgi:hypothetical protein
MPNLYFYVMTHDSGFAPCVSKGMLTLATCKPRIRNSASDEPSDYVMGVVGKILARKAGVKRYSLVFLSKISKKKDYDWYYEHHKKRRDCIYHRDPKNHRWVQEPDSPHDGEKQKKVDTRAPYVLISRHFVYLGRDCQELPKGARTILTLLRKAPRSHRKRNLSNPRLKKWVDDIFRKYKGRPHEPIEKSESRHSDCKRY